MIVNEEQRKELADAAAPMVEWLRKNAHPHASIRIDATSVTLVEDVGRITYEWQEPGR